MKLYKKNIIMSKEEGLKKIKIFQQETALVLTQIKLTLEEEEENKKDEDIEGFAKIGKIHYLINNFYRTTEKLFSLEEIRTTGERTVTEEGIITLH